MIFWLTVLVCFQQEGNKGWLWQREFIPFSNSFRSSLDDTQMPDCEKKHLPVVTFSCTSETDRMTSFGSISASSCSFAIPFLQSNLHYFKYCRNNIYQVIQNVLLRNNRFSTNHRKKKSCKREKDKMAQLTLADKYELKRAEFMPCSVRNFVYDHSLSPSLLPNCRIGILQTFSFLNTVAGLRETLRVLWEVINAFCRTKWRTWVTNVLKIVRLL